MKSHPFLRPRGFEEMASLKYNSNNNCRLQAFSAVFQPLLQSRQ